MLYHWMPEKSQARGLEVLLFFCLTPIHWNTSLQVSAKQNRPSILCVLRRREKKRRSERVYYG